MARCSKCGKSFGYGNTNGLPNGITMEFQDNKRFTLCQSCIIKLGQLSGKEKEEFVKNLKED